MNDITILFAILLVVGAVLILLPIVLLGVEVEIRRRTGILMMAIGFLLFIVGMIGIMSVG